MQHRSSVVATGGHSGPVSVRRSEQLTCGCVTRSPRMMPMVAARGRRDAMGATCVANRGRERLGQRVLASVIPIRDDVEMRRVAESYSDWGMR